MNKLSKQLLIRTSPKNRSKELRGDTDILNDLGLYGDDVFEVLLWLKSEFGLEITAEIIQCIPGEHFARPLLRNFVDNPFKITINDIMEALEIGAWRGAQAYTRSR